MIAEDDAGAEICLGLLKGTSDLRPRSFADFESPVELAVVAGMELEPHDGSIESLSSSLFS